MTPEQVLEFYGKQAWKDLAAESWPGRVVHGEKLVLAMAEADNVDKARKCWRAAEELGLVKRAKYNPSRQQQFFGLGGLSGPEAIRDPDKTGHDEVAYEWEFC